MKEETLETAEVKEETEGWLCLDEVNSWMCTRVVGGGVLESLDTKQRESRSNYFILEL